MRVFDPRPPAWRSFGTHIFAIAVLVILILFVFWNHRSGGSAGGGIPTTVLFISTDGDAISPFDDDEYEISHLVRQAFQISYTESEHKRETSVDFLPVTVHDVQWPERQTDGPMTAEEFVDKYPRWASVYEASLSHHLLFNEKPQWAHEAILCAIGSRASYSKVTYNPRYYAWIGSIVLLILLVPLLTGQLFVLFVVNMLYQRVQKGRCPRCRYLCVEMSICPECGLGLLRESKRLLTLHTNGYRGLMLFMKEEIAPT